MNKIEQLTFYVFILFGFFSCTNDGTETEDVTTGMREGHISPSNEIVEFFQSELPFHGCKPDFFEREGSFYPDEETWGKQFCLTINSNEDFKDIYNGLKNLPDIDFSKTTLIIGRLYDHEYRFANSLDSMLLYKLGKDEYSLGLYITVKKSAQPASAAFDGYLEGDCLIYFWGLYPKFKTKEIPIYVYLNKIFS